MVRIVGAILLLSFAAILPADARTVGEEIPSRRLSGGNAGAGWWDFDRSRIVTEASSRRRTYFYSWRGTCYARDRSRNWHWVDSGLC